MTNQEAIEYIKSIKGLFHTGIREFYEALEKAIEALEKQKTGHWIYICNSQITGLKIVECSECGNRTYGSGKFCPNCGVKMEGDK